MEDKPLDSNKLEGRCANLVFMVLLTFLLSPQPFPAVSFPAVLRGVRVATLISLQVISLKWPSCGLVSGQAKSSIRQYTGKIILMKPIQKLRHLWEEFAVVTPCSLSLTCLASVALTFDIFLDAVRSA